MKQNKQEQILKEKLWDLIIEFDAFQHIRNSIIASSQAEKYHNEVMKLLSQSRQEAVEEEREAFLRWAKENKHDMGEMGEFVRIKYLENWVNDDFSYHRENWNRKSKIVKSLSSKKVK